MASRRIVMDILARTASFESGLNRIERRLAGFGKAVRGVSGVLGGLLSAAGLGAVINKAINLGDSLDHAATKAKVSGRAMSEIAHAANLANVGLDGLSTGLKQMQVFTSQAASGSKEATATLKALGLEVKNLRGIAADRQLERFAEQISKLKVAEDRTRAATEVFGRAGADLLPLFEQGAAGIRKAREEAQRLGISMSDENIKKLAAADDVVKKLGSSFGSLAAVLTAKVAPAFTSFFNQLAGLDSERETIERSISLLESPFVGLKIGSEEQAKAIANLRQKLEQLDAFERGIEARRAGAGRRGRRGRAPAGDPAGFAADISLPDRVRRDRTLELAAEDRIGAISVDEIERARATQFFEGIEEDAAASLEHINEEMDRSTKHWLSGVEIFRDGAKSAFQDLIETGKFKFKDFMKFLVLELAKKEVFDAIDSIADRMRGAFSGKPSPGGGGGGGFFRRLFGFDEGTNRVPRDMPAFLHKDEAVVPAKYNPAAGGRGRGSVTIIQHINNGPFYSGSDQELRAMMPRIQQQTARTAVEMVRNEVGRGRL